MNDDRHMQNDSPLRQRARWLENYCPDLRIVEQGKVISVGDGIALISGLPSAGMDAMLLFEDGSYGMVFDLDDNAIGAVLLRSTEQLTAGTKVYLSSGMPSVDVGAAMLGRVVDPLGLPLDEQAQPRVDQQQALEAHAPPIIARDFVNRPLYTGNKIIDTLIPIGKGQRQLLIGDEGLGRTSIALDSVINQRGKNVMCIYVLIGQKRSTIVNVIDTLREFDALAYTTIVVAEASALPGLQYIAPYTGCALAEFWMQRGHDTLVVYDDLSTHAKTYRELSLLLRRPPGREAYPGDIFSIHARLLERATCLNAEHGGGTMTALPIIETQQGEIAAYIPTNLISITDGQIYLERQLFTSGFRPAIDIARSVSRIGGNAQHMAIKKEAGRMKLDYLQFLELEIFTRFGAKLEASMEASIQRGRLLREILKQDRLNPLPEIFQLAWLIAFNEGLLNALLANENSLQASAVTNVLQRLLTQVEQSDLTLDTPRDRWLQTLQAWLQLSALQTLESAAP